MNPEEVVPPSPQVELDKKLSGQVKRRRSSTRRHTKKSQHPIKSLRLKNLEKSNGHETTDELSGVSVLSDDLPVGKKINAQIYANLDDDDDNEENQQPSESAALALNGFDILAQSKLIEECNQYDLSQKRQQQPTTQNFTHRISASPNLCSLATFLVTQQHANENQLATHSPTDSDDTTTTTMTSPLDTVAKEISQENLQFSEWPTDLRDTNRTNGQAQNGNDCENLSASSIVYNILHDFCDDDDVDDQDETAQTPTFILIRRAQRKTYERTSTAQYKNLLFVDSGGGGGSSSGDEDDNHDRDNISVVSQNVANEDNQRCDKGDDEDDIDIDLNSSRAIVENLTKLSTFFTQSQSHELDFNVDLAQHTINDFEKRFDSFELCDSDDDFHNDRIQISYSNTSDIEIEVAATTTTSAVPVAPATTSETTNHKLDTSLFSEHDDFENFVTHIETPKGLMPCPKENQPKVNKILTSISSKEIGIEDSGMHSTPSTSKASTTLNDHRVAKRLHFAAETNLMEIQNGFSLASAHNVPDSGMMGGFATARGGAIQLTEKAMKRAAGTFIDIDSKYKHIDAMADDEPQFKRLKTSGKSVTFKEGEPERPKGFEINGFQMANGKNAKLAKARNIFDDFNLSDLNESVNEHQPIAIAGPSNGPDMGFSTARGANIAVKKTNMQKYANVLVEIDRDICKDTGAIDSPDTNFNQNQFERKSRNIFDNINLSDLDDSTNELQPIAIAGPSNGPEMGFTTARGSNIAVTSTNMQRYGRVLEDIDRDICKEAGAINDTNSTCNHTALECKTPLAKLNHQRRPNAFATSTPNPNVTPGFKNTNLPPITPINKQNIAELHDFNNWTRQVGYDFEELFTQQHTNDVGQQNESVNDTDASDLQQSIDGSYTETGGIDVIHISDSIKSARRKALSEQQTECFKKPHSISSLYGRLFLQKIKHSMQLHDLGTPKTYTRDELQHFGVQPNVIDVDANNALQFKFDMWHFYPMYLCKTNVDGIDVGENMKLIMDENSRVGVREMTSAFLQCLTIDPKLIPDHWITNGLKWIIIKLASYERSFPEKFGGRSLTPENVLAQLKYRYDREIDRVERSAIRRIVERDDTPAKRMILFVSRISEQSLVYSIELSDGWYAIRTHSLDTVLSNAINKGKIVVGTKLVIQGAELMGIEEGCSPLEMPRSVALKISANSTRRAKWYTKLGYCKEPWPFAISLNSIHEKGGLITRTTAYIVRVYPLVYAIKEKTADSQKTVYRSNKVEQREGRKDDRKHFEIYEKFYSEAAAVVEKEYESKMKKYKSPRKKLSDIDDGEELWNFMEHSNDGISYEFDLTATQKKMLNDYQTKIYDEKQNKITAIVKEKLNAFDGPAKSTPLQKVRLIDASTPNAHKSAILSIWNFSDMQTSLRENTLLDLQYVTANGMRGKDMLLTAGNMTVLREIGPSTSTIHSAYSRQLTPISEIDAQQFKPNFNELDTLGLVVKVDEAMPNHFQSVFVADANHNLLCMKFWGGIQQHAYEDIVKEMAIIVISQLDWRPYSRLNLNGIPQAFVTEITTFTENPKSSERIYALNCLREQFDQINLSIFIDECVTKLAQDNHSNKENSITNSSFNTSSNQSIHSHTAPEILQRVDRLRKYGEPPPLSKSFLKTQKLKNSSANKPFKNPCQQATSSSSRDSQTQ